LRRNLMRENVNDCASSAARPATALASPGPAGLTWQRASLTVASSPARAGRNTAAVAGPAGAPALEAYPVDTDVPGHTRNLFLGVASVPVPGGKPRPARARRATAG
jgi:hypothetical protein